jgi:serine/threonine protein kinase
MTAFPTIGDLLGPYEILSPIGSGGMGRVFRAHDMRLRRDVAIKVLKPAYAADPEMRGRLEREARSIAALTHPGIVAIYDVGTADDLPFIVMELLHGANLRARLAAAALTCDSAIDIAAQMAEALAAAHAAGIVHRDLKPENVFIELPGDSADGAAPAVRLLDFGVARFYEPPAGTGDTPLTGLGVLIGTLSYMAPEQALHPSECDEQVDVWALGVMLYEALSGIRPIEGVTGPETMRKLLVGGITPLRVLAPDLPDPVTELVTGMLARSPERRPRGLDSIAATLRRFEPVT